MLARQQSDGARLAEANRAEILRNRFLLQHF